MNPPADPIRLAPRRLRALTRATVCALAVLLPLGTAKAAVAAEPHTPELRATGMTFVGSRGESSELVLRSATATFHPDRDLANLEDVHAVFTDDAHGDSFELTCDRAELNVETNDFRAEGDVRGATADGQRYSAPWVEYDHESGVLHTSAPVAMVDKTGTYRGNGFRYDIRQRRFQLLGNVTVEQNP